MSVVQPSRPMTLDEGRGARAHAAAPLAPAEARQRLGKRLIVLGSVVTILGVLLYCGVCFTGGLDADMGDMLLRNSVPFARATLGVLGLGTLIWIMGSFTYLRGAMDMDEDARDPDAPPQS